MKVQNPLTGHSSGKLGNTIFQTQYGYHIVRSKPIMVRNPKSPGQVLVRNKFELASSFIRAALILVRIGYHNYKPHNSAYSAAIGYLLNNCMQLVTDVWALDYTSIKLSFGNLLTATFSASIVIHRGTSSSLSHSDNSGSSNALSTDTLYYLFHNSTLNKSTFKSGTRGSESTDISNCGRQWNLGDTIHVYAFFQSADLLLKSNTVYVGSTTLIV